MGRLVGLRRGQVVVGRRGLITERGEQPGLIQLRQLGRQVAYRPAVQLKCLAMGRYRTGLAGGGDGVLVGGSRASRLLEVGRDEGAAVAAFGGGGGHPLVQAAAQGQIRVGVQGVADQRVPEIEGDRISAGQDEVRLLQLTQGAGHLIRAGVGDGGEQVEVEGAADDGGRRGHAARWRAQAAGPAQHGVAQRVGHRRRRYRRTRLRGEAALVDGGQEFLDVQRDAVGALVDRRH